MAAKRAKGTAKLTTDTFSTVRGEKRRAKRRQRFWRRRRQKLGRRRSHGPRACAHGPTLYLIML